MGGVSSASSSMSVRSLGRSRTQTLSSLSTARPVTPPSFHLLGRGLGQSGSNLNLGATGGCATSDTHRTNAPRAARARLHTFFSRLMNLLLGRDGFAPALILQHMGATCRGGA